LIASFGLPFKPYIAVYRRAERNCEAGAVNYRQILCDVQQKYDFQSVKKAGITLAGQLISVVLQISNRLKISTLRSKKTR
jgi:phosphatidylserine decarboxylase